MKNKLFILFIIILVIILTFIGIKLLNKDSDNSSYTIITDFHYITMQNDGGSNFNVYYEFTPNTKTIKKLEDYYIGFKGYEYQGKLVYNKTLSDTTAKKLSNLLKDLISKEDINSNNNYKPFVIKHNNTEKEIYNKESIKLLKEKLDEIDKS